MVHQIEHEAARRVRAWRLLAAGIAATVMTGVLVAWAAGCEPDQVATGPAHRPAARQGDAAVQDRGHRTPGSTPDRALEQVEWTQWRGLALPTSSLHGPWQTAGPRTAGFSRDVPGAVLAAIHVSVRSAPYAGPGVFRATISAQVTGRDKQAYLARMENEYETERLRSGIADGAPLPQPPMEFMGWRNEAATGSRVPVHLLIAAVAYDGSQHCADVRVPMVWSGGDWLVTAPPGGDGSSEMTRVSCRSSDYHLIPRQG